MGASDRRARWIWSATAIAIAATLFWAATNNEVYDVTSPPAFSFHVLLRKLYSIAAFAVVGFTGDKALGPSTRAVLRAALLVAIYSGAIEIAQAFRGSHEGLAWNAIDILCGFIGGWLAIAATRRPQKKSP